MSKVLKVDCSTGGGDIKKNFGTNYSEAWLYADVALNAIALADLLTNPFSSTVFDLIQLQAQTFEYSGMEWYVDAGPVVKWAAYNNGPGDPASTPFNPASPIASMQFYRVKMHVVAGTPITQEVWIDGVSIGTINVTASNQPNLRILDLFQPGLTDAGFMYFDNVKVGTTDGASDIFSDDFESGGLAGWTSADAVFSVVDDPGITPAGAGGGGAPAALTIRIYDLGTTVLADISAISLTKKLLKQAGTATSYVVTAPANHPLLTTLADDGLPNLDEGGDRKLVVWEDADPDTEDPIFHGRIYKPERTGDANSTQVAITAYDARMELGYEADNRAGRIVRDSSATSVGDPSFLTPEFTSSVPDQDGISGPDLIQQILTYSQGDPTTNPVQGEGPLPIDVISGTWDLDVPPAIDLNPVDSADWPVLVGDLINQLVETDAVDFVLRPIRPGTGLNLDGDPDPYIMVEASAVSKAGADLTATVHFDYFTGNHNAMAARAETDFATVCDRLWYELGPRLNKQHWRGDITPHGALHPDLLPLMDAAADKYGGPDTFKGYLASFRIFDSLGSENSSRPLYEALYRAEVLWRLQPRFLLHITPAPGEKALFTPPQDFDVYDLVRITTGPDFGVELDEAQRVYGYTKEWTREGVAKVSELQTSADVA